MPTLNAGASIVLGPYPRGARLTFTAPQTDNIFNFPTLNGVAIALTFLPKTITLAQGNAYTLTAGAVNIDYNVQQ
jgi:hypothetical protein